jgi:hypothetical protein
MNSASFKENDRMPGIMTRATGPRRVSGDVFSVIALLALTSLVVGCISDVTPPRQVLWEAVLEGSPDQLSVTGSAAAIGRANHTEASISVTGLADGTYSRAIRHGRCDEPGEMLGPPGAYPPLLAEEGETVSAEASTTARMSAAGRYHAEVRAEATADRAACGNFAPWEL